MGPRVLALVAAVGVVSCSGSPLRPVSAEFCDAAGVRLRELACVGSVGQPLWQSAGGIPFAEICKRAASQGRDLRAEYVARMHSCSQLTDLE